MSRAWPWAVFAAGAIVLTACSRTPLDLFQDASFTDGAVDAGFGPTGGNGPGFVDSGVVTREGGAADGGGSIDAAGIDGGGLGHDAALDASLDGALDGGFDAGIDGGCDPTTDPHGCIVGGFTSLVLSGQQSTTCFISSDGALYCWGQDLIDSSPAALRASPVRIGTARYRDVSVGTGHACAIREDGKLLCWGHNCAGQLGGIVSGSQSAPTEVGSATNWRSVVVGGGYTFLLDDAGALSYFGNDIDREGSTCQASHAVTLTFVGGTWKQLTAHRAGAYGVKDDGTLWRLWSSKFGEAAPASAQRMGTSNWRTISTGPYLTCGIREDSSLACAEEPSLTAAGFAEERIGLAGDWGDKIAVAYDACAIKKDGTLWCWSGPIGPQSGNKRFWGGSKTPVQASAVSGWSAVTQGEFGGCGLLDGEVVCWGDNHAGELGIGVSPYQPAPTSVVGATTGWSKPRTSLGSACAFRGSEISCWGDPTRGLLGFKSDRTYKQHPTAHAMESWQDAQMGAFITCAIDPAQDLKCWGDQLGTNSHAGYSLAAKLKSVGRGRRSCAIDVRDVGWCWPSSYDSGGVYVGQPTPSTSYLPKSITSAKYRTLTSSDYHTCGITTTGTLSCWGGNSRGETGRGTRSAYETAASAVAGATSWLDVSASLSNDGVHAAYTCAVSDDGGQGRLFCWGDGSYGRLGNGTGSGALSPLQVGTRASWLRVATGARRACAVTSNGELWCWGDNLRGELGIGADDATLHVPERVGASNLWVDVSVSDHHACAVTNAGALQCWGVDQVGELGNDSAWRDAPTAVAF